MINFFWVDAGIFLFTSNAYGKSWNITNHYHPNLVWGYDESLDTVFEKRGFFLEDCHKFGAKSIDGIFYLQNESEELGKFFNCKIRIAFEAWLKDYVSIGKHFYIREGAKVVGFGIALSNGIISE